MGQTHGYKLGAKISPASRFVLDKWFALCYGKTWRGNVDLDGELGKYLPESSIHAAGMVD